MRENAAVRREERGEERPRPNLSLVPATVESPPRRRWETVALVVASAALHVGAVGWVTHARAAEPAKRPVFKVEVSLSRPPPPTPPVVPPQATKPPPRVRPRPVAAPPTPTEPPREAPPVMEEAPAASGVAPIGPEGTVVAGEGPVGTGVVAGPVVAESAPPPPAPVIQAHEGANYLKNPRPAYPPLALERGWQGNVLLKVQVGPDGRPLVVQVSRSSGRAMLDEAAVATVRTWTFVPARQGGRAVTGWVSVPIVFQLQ